MAFAYITRGNSSPHGKAKVCLLCHLDDLPRYLNEISQDIFVTQNCAIWYVDDNHPITDYEFELNQMQLIVVPITRKLLSEESDLLLSGIPAAIKNRIPILPILVESGLDTLFSQYFGDLEYLDKTSMDLTAIPYKDKLASYLGKVLFDDDQVRKIKDAFDAYIFLSYRKKDRVFAQELMRLIHQNDFCEKVAIWYDEFLTPGEGFNEAIENALKKSNLFSLVVTPNIVDEKNYIMDVEYPLAQKEKKIILPVEMVKTPVEQLQDIYEGIPTPIELKNSDALSNALRDYLSLALNSKKDDTVHTFFVGLAYLSGIDVEIDRDRAYKMILAAAEAGLEQAIKKLVHMYVVGDGVDKNVAKAIEWQKKLTWRLGDTADESRNENDALLFLREQMYLTELAYSIEDYETATKSGSIAYKIAKTLAFGTIEKNAVKKVVSVFKKYILNKSPHFEESLVHLVKTCRIMLYISYAMAIHEDINEWTGKAMNVANILMKTRDDDPRVVLEILKIAGKMATELVMSGNLTGAEKWFEVATDMYVDMSDEYKTSEIEYGFLSIHNAACEYHICKKEYSNAYACQEEIKKTLQSLHDEFPENYQFRSDIIKCWLREAEIAYLYGDLNEALSNTLSAKKAIDEEIINQLGISDIEFERTSAKDLIDGEQGKGVSLDVKLSLAKYYTYLGLKECSDERYERAIVLLRDGALGILKPILDVFFDVEHIRDAVLINEKIGDCFFSISQYSNAYEWHSNALELLDNVLVFSKLVRDSRGQAVLFEKLLDDSIELKDSLKIAEWNEKALWMRNGLVNSIGFSQQGLKKEQAISTIAEKGKIEIAYYEEDVQALHNLLNRQDAISGLVEKYMSREDILSDYIKRSSDETTLDLKELSGIIHSMQETIGAVNLRNELHAFEAIIDRIERLTDILEDDSVSITEVKRLTKTIYDFYYENLKPFAKYDEEGMLLASFCGFINNSLRIMGQETANRSFNRFFDEIVFWNYPMDRIKHPDLWRTIYRSVKDT